MFDWTYLDGSGEEMGRSPRFADADQAEDWIGSSWPDLLEHGVEAVVLYDHGAGRKVYRMGLGSD
ncbi:MAG: hypothetical protein WB297_02890 [Actinomycetota bacterium]